MKKNNISSKSDINGLFPQVLQDLEHENLLKILNICKKLYEVQQLTNGGKENND